MTKPGDAISKFPANADDAGPQFDAAKAIDNQTNTKYALRKGAGKGFEVTLGSGPAVVNELKLTTAADLKDRDPGSYKLEGKTQGGAYKLIKEGTLSLPDARNATTTIPLNNSVPYATYRLTFPALRAGSSETTLQIGEVELIRNVSSLELTDAELDKVTAGTLILGDNTARPITLTENITRPGKTNVRINTTKKFETGNFTIDTAGGRLDLPYTGPPNFSESGKTLNVDLNVANTNLAISNDGTNYVLPLTGGTWSGTSSHVTGNGTGNLLVTPTGKAHFDTIRITDSAQGGSVTFNDSGSNTYSDQFVVDLNETGAGTITFNGSTSFTGAAALSASTSRNIVVSSGAGLKTVDGELALFANQQYATTQGDFSGIEVRGTVEATGKGDVTIEGKAGSKSTSARVSGVNVDGGRIAGGKSGTLTVNGNGGQGTGGQLAGVLVTGSGTITSTGADVDVTGKGGISTGTGNAGVVIDANSQITAGGNGVVSVTGTGGAGASGWNAGVVAFGGTVTSGGGNVTVTGTGGGQGSSGGAYGVASLGNGTITAGGSGTITIVGRGGPGTGAANHGVNVSSGGKITSTSGSLVAAGVAGKANGMGIVVDSAISNTGSGSGIALIADTIDITSNGAVTDDDDTVLLRPLAPGRGIRLGQPSPVADVTAPGDTVSAVGGAEVTGFEAAKAIDGQPDTKYANRGGNGSGLEVTLGGGGAVVTGLKLTTAGDLKDRDPGSYMLEGKVNPGDSYVTISQGQLALPDARNATSATLFDNTAAYKTYRLTFPSFRTGATESTMQIGEVELLGRSPESLLTDAALDRVTAGTLRIGDFDSGPIVVSADITRPAKTNIQLASGKTIDRGGKTIDTKGGYLRVNQNGRITDGTYIDRGDLRFFTTGTFTNDSTDDPVQVGFVPRLTDVTAPTDPISAIGGSSPSDKGVSNAIDGGYQKPYLNFGGVGSGFEVTPAKGASVVTGLRFTTGPDYRRSPAGYKLEGKIGNGSYVKITEDDNLDLPGVPGALHSVQFANTTAYTSYRLTFTKLKGPASEMEIDDVELLSRSGPGVPLLALPGGVTIQGDKFSTTGEVSAIAGSEVRDLFRGIVNGDITQRILIPFAALTGKGFVIPSDQAITSPLDAKSTFKPTLLKFALPNGKKYPETSRVELSGELKFAALDGAGVQLKDKDGLIGGANGFTLKIDSENLPVVPAGRDSNNNATPLTFTLGGLKFQTDTLTAYYQSNTGFLFGGTAKAHFVEIDLHTLGDVIRPTDLTSYDAHMVDNVSGPGIDMPTWKWLDITPSTGPSIVQELRVDSSARLPASYELRGRTGSGPDTHIAKGPLQFDSSGRATVQFKNDNSYTQYKLRFPTSQQGDSSYIKEIDLIGVAPESSLQIKQGQLSPTLNLNVKALSLGGVSYDPAQLKITLDQTNEKATIRGKTKTLSGAAVDFGAVGFGVDADPSDSDNRVGPEIVIQNERLSAFSLPLKSLKAIPASFVGRSITSAAKATLRLRWQRDHSVSRSNSRNWSSKTAK